MAGTSASEKQECTTRIDRTSRFRAAGLGFGIVTPALMLLAGPPGQVTGTAWAAAAVAVMMATWWISEPIPLPATALLPLVLFPFLGVAPISDVAPAYADPLIFLFFGGFILAAALQRHGLHRWLALHMVRIAGRSPSAIIAAIMGATAFLSMWVSNTAAAMVMLPIGLSMVDVLSSGRTADETTRWSDFSAALMLAIAYSATIGGMATLIGTPPNALFAAHMKAQGVTFGFVEWMRIGLPAVLVLLPLTWFVLTRISFSIPRDLAIDVDVLGRPAELRPQQKVVGLVLLATALAWLLRPLLSGYLQGIPLSDAGIALTAAVLLFLLPEDWRSGRALLSWSDVANLRWDVLILFGGGLALADAIAKSGLASTIGEALQALVVVPLPLLLLVTMFCIVFLGELASNTAIAAIFLPVGSAAVLALGVPQVTFALPIALAASLGFMLPVATPPNAIVYGSNVVSSRQMLRAGLVLNLTTVPIVAFLAYVLAGP